MNLIILLVLLSLSLGIALMCYEFYTTAKENHIRFRYWFAIGVLNAFHIGLAIYLILSGDARFQEVRWATFALMEILYLEIFLRADTFRHRRTELFVRTYYYYMVLSTPVVLFWPLDIIIALTLSYLAYKDGQKWFCVSFVLYAFTTIIPEIFGYGTTESFMMGALFMCHLMLGVHRLYKAENIDITQSRSMVIRFTRGKKVK